MMTCFNLGCFKIPPPLLLWRILKIREGCDTVMNKHLQNVHHYEYCFLTTVSL